MLRLLRQKCQMLVDRGLPCIESLVNACTVFKTDWAPKSSLLRISRDASLLRPVQVRRYSSDKPEDCPEEKKCDTEMGQDGVKSCGPAKFKGTICGQAKPKKKTEAKKPDAPKKPKSKFVSMWHIPGCEYVPKCDIPVRLDISHYRISDKEKRDYQVTWNECPRLLIKPKKVCLYRRSGLPKPCRRKRKLEAATARPSMATLNPMPCLVEDVNACPRFVLPCCGPVRNPPTCKRTRTMTDCKKRPAPYPSFSECQRDELLQGPPIECLCLRVPMACEMWAEMRRRIAQGKSVVNKCGEV